MDKLEAGDKYGNYQVLRVLGEGGFATVYLAEDVRPAMSRQVALKILDDRFADDPDFRDRFTRESRMAANLDHPNVAPIFDAGEIDGRLYIAMRFIDGMDLKERLAQGELSADECVAILRQIGSALDDAHGKGLIHRDVKPGNVLLDHGRADRVYLADFGITKEIGDGKEFTQAGTFLGTLSYASPEQLDGRALDGRSDQYAFACLLYEALTGTPPFSGSLQTILNAHVAKPPPKVTSRTDRFPVAIDAVVAKGMAKTPEGRYATCSEFAEAAAGALLGTGATGAPEDDEAVTGETIIGGLGLAAAGAGDPTSTIVTAPQSPVPEGARPEEAAADAPGVAAAPSDSRAPEPGPPEAPGAPVASEDPDRSAPEAAPESDLPATKPEAPVTEPVAAAATSAAAPPPPPPRKPLSQPTPSAPKPEQNGGGRKTAAVLGLLACLAVVGLISFLVVNNQSDRDDGTASPTSAAPTSTTTPTATTDTTAPTTTTSVVTTTTTTAAPTFTGPVRTIRPLRAIAPPSAADDVDGCGAATSYEPDNMIDEDETTGWRMDGDGEAQRVRVNLGGPTRVSRVGIINGLDELDCSGTDRYLEQRRFTSVRWIFDDGTDVLQTLDPTDRGLQTIDVDAITSRVSAVIGETEGGATMDFTAIAEIEINGVVADATP